MHRLKNKIGQGFSEKQDCSHPTPSRSGPAAQRSLLLMLIRLIGQQTFRAVLVQHKGAESTEFPYAPLMRPPSLIHQQSPSPEGSWCWHHHYPESRVYLRAHSWGCTFSGCGQCIMSCIHHLSIIQNSFTPLKILCALPVLIPPYT